LEGPCRYRKATEIDDMTVTITEDTQMKDLD
jgi:hypothetical protein